MKKILYVFSCLCIMGCANKGEQVKETTDLTVEGETYTVKANSPTCSKIKTETIKMDSFSNEFQTVGTVRAIAGKLAEVAVPFDGRITSAKVQLGQKVSAGTPLFGLNSSEFHEASKAYFQAKQNYELAQNNAQRKKQLLGAGIASKRDVEEAETEALNAQAELQQAKASIKMFNVSTDRLVIGQPLTITSPISGEVVKCNITTGQFTKTDDEAVVTVADLSKVWVVAQVKEHFIGSIHKGDQVEIITEARPDETIWGKITHISEMLDEETRALEVMVECDNASRLLKPGMYTSVHFQSVAKEGIVIPSSALFQNEDETTVFVEKAKNVYERRSIKSESMSNGKAHVTVGLKAGETIVVNGGIFLSK